MGSWSIFHWLVVLVIAILVFGTGKISKAGRDLGSAIRGFKGGLKASLKEDDEEINEETAQITSQRSTTHKETEQGPTTSQPLSSTSSQVSETKNNDTSVAKR